MPLAEQIPKMCKAGVVVDEGPNFRVEIKMVPVPLYVKLRYALRRVFYAKYTDLALQGPVVDNVQASKERALSLLSILGPDEILLKLNVTGLCMSDVHYMLSDWDLGPMSQHGIQSPGHEGVGVVAKLGSNVKDWKVGDRGGVKPLWNICNDCELCHTGRDAYCTGATYTGFSVPDSFVLGTYQQYITSPARYTSRIPDDVPDSLAAPIMCAGSTMHRALIESQLEPGHWAAFPGGGGGVGIQGVQLAKAMGIRCIVIDSGEKKKELALSMGAEAYVDFTTSKNVVADVIEIAGGVGAHGVFVTAWQAYKDAVKFVGKRISARVVSVALPPFDAVFLGADPIIFVSRNLTIMGSMAGSLRDTDAVLDYANRGLVKQISEVRGLGAMPESVQQLKRGEVAGRIVIDFNKD